MSSKICPKCNTENPIAASYCRNCGEPFSKESKSGKTIRPTIKECTIMNGFYTIGSTIEIMWEVENAMEITINGDVVTDKLKYDYYVENATTIDLIASNEFAKDIRKIRINPSPLPKIHKFEASKSRIKPGEKIKISFDYKAEKAFLQSNKSKEINLSCKKKVEVQPQSGEEYTLVCYSKDPHVFVTKELNLTILEEPFIESFEADSYNIIESTPIRLSWKVSNASSITLLPNNLDVTDMDSIVLHPTQSTDYSLRAVNELSTHTSVLSVGVVPLPKMRYETPNIEPLIALNSLDISVPSFVSNIHEINIDEWMLNPLSAKRVSSISRLMKNSKSSLLSILPGADTISKCMRLALIIVALLVFACSIAQIYICNLVWVRILSAVCLIVNALYIIAVFVMTKSENADRVNTQDLMLCYWLLLISSVSPLTMFLCGADYQLFEILGIYIFGEFDKLILPFATLFFLSISYWMPIKAIYGIQEKQSYFSNIKSNVYNEY